MRSRIGEHHQCWSGSVGSKSDGRDRVEYLNLSKCSGTGYRNKVEGKEEELLSQLHQPNV